MCTAPFGRPVVPDVYSMTTGSSGAAGTGLPGAGGADAMTRHDRAPSGTRAPTTTTRKPRPAAALIARASSASRRDRYWSAVTTTVEPDCASWYVASGTDSPVLSGTTIAPARTAA